MKKFILLIFLAISSIGFSQEYNFKDAKKLTSEVLKVLKNTDLPKKKEMLADLVFDPSSSFPNVLNSKIISEKLFDTDVEGVKGYKAFIESKTDSNKMQYVMISFLDRNENKWKVFSLRKSVETDKEVISAKARLTEKTDITAMQFKLRNLAFWQILNGEFKDANTNYLEAQKVATANKDTEFSNSTYLLMDKIVDVNSL